MYFNRTYTVVLLIPLLFSCASIKISRIKKKTPASCEEAVEQVEALEKLLRGSWNRSGEIRQIIFEKLDLAIDMEPGCTKARLKLGDMALQSGFYIDSTLLFAREVYEEGIRYDPTNPELNARLAFIYDITDSVELAGDYYARINTSRTSFFDVDTMRNHFNRSDSLVEIYMENSDESYILLERIPTYYFEKPPGTYCRISGNGDVEYNEYFGDSKTPVYFRTKYH